MRWVFVLLLLGCDAQAPSQEAPEELPEPSAITLRDLFPSRIGDRWRERAATGARTRGVTAQIANGLVVFFGQGDTRPTFYRIEDDQVSLASPDGETIAPLLRSPIRLGASWTYGGDAPCTATWRSVGESREIAGVGLEDCATVETVCEHPVGGPFEAPTRRTTRESFCPGVGRVSSTTQLDPPLSGSEALTGIELVYWRVTDAPIAIAPEPFDCDSMLLLASDMHAACGTGWRWVGEESLEAGCVHRFEQSGSTAEVRISEHGASAAAALDTLLSEHDGEPADEGDAPAAGVTERMRSGPGGLLAADHRNGFVLTLTTSQPSTCAHPRGLFPVLRSIVSS